MKRILLATMISASFAVLGPVGCGSSQTVKTTAVSTGQQLEDLQKAYDQGLMTEQEYQKERKRIMEGK